MKNWTAVAPTAGSEKYWISVKTLAAYIGVRIDANQKTEYDTLISVKNYIWCENFKSIEEKTIINKKNLSQKKNVRNVKHREAEIQHVSEPAVGATAVQFSLEWCH